MFVKLFLFVVATVLVQHAAGQEESSPTAREALESMSVMMREAMDQGQESRMLESMRQAFRDSDTARDTMTRMRSLMRRRTESNAEE